MTHEPIHADTGDVASPAISSAASAAAEPARAQRRPRCRGISTILCLLLSLLALSVSAYVGWRQWQQQAQADTEQRLFMGLQAQAAARDQQHGVLRQQLDKIEQQHQGLRDAIRDGAERTRKLESVVARLSERTLAARYALALDEVETLLRMGQQRYQLFHDARNAAQAYALAEQSLAALDEPRFVPLRKAVQAERQALENSQAVTEQSALATLSALRTAVLSLPLKPLDTGAADSAAQDGVWARIRHALLQVVSVRHDQGLPLLAGDAQISRELLALDLAQAQAALLAYDNAAYTAAIARARAGLAAFDHTSAPFIHVEAQLAMLANVAPPAPVTLGAALSQLRELRAIQAVAATVPAGASSSAVVQP